jgi:hypothetical protein
MVVAIIIGFASAGVMNRVVMNRVGPNQQADIRRDCFKTCHPIDLNRLLPRSKTHV